jgi:hypothetical protein
MTGHASWRRSIDHLKPKFSLAMNRAESHPEFAALFGGLEQVTHLFDLKGHKPTPISDLRETLTRAISTTEKLQKLIASLNPDEAEAIDQDYFSAFSEYAKQDADSIRPSSARQRKEPHMRHYLEELRRCDEERAGINILMEILLNALVLRKVSLPAAGKGKRGSIHPYKYYLVEMAKIVNGLGRPVTSGNSKTTVYYKYCLFFLDHITDSRTSDPVRQIAEAAREFEEISASKKNID